MEKYAGDGKSVDEIYDLLAVRVLVETVTDCYTALGVVHGMWRPLPGSFDDYIGNPKESMYQSLHTTVMALNAQPLEVQIRTYEMHRSAEYRHRGPLALQGGVEARRPLRGAAGLAAPVARLAARDLAAGGDDRGGEDGHLPGPGVRLHA